MLNKIILASKSKVRKKILDENNITSQVEPSNVDEDIVKESLLKEQASPSIISKNLAELKANKVSLKFINQMVLGADSVIDLNGELISNKDYEGKVYIVEFFFTTCPTICPIMNYNLVEIQNSFSEFDNLGFASFTINPEYDTVEVLSDYANQFGITNKNWNLLTGDKEEIYKLALESK